MRFRSNARSTAYAILVVLLVGWWYAASLEWRGEREADHILSRRDSIDQLNATPLVAAPQRQAAQRLLVSREPDYAQVDSFLAEAINLRPLYAPYWLDRARTVVQAGDIEAADGYLSTATALWPTRAILLWRAAMLYAQMGEADATLRVLHDYLYADPGGYEQAVVVGLRMESDYARMLDKLLPTDFPGTVTRDEVVWEILRYARRQNVPDMGIAAWGHFSEEGKRQLELAAYYVEWMASLENQREAIAAWGATSPNARSVLLENGGFEAPLRGGLGWRSADKEEGVVVSRDDDAPYKGGHSLKVDFSGTNNVHFKHLRQYLPVQPGVSYVLDYRWRGEGISTRSGPYVEISLLDGTRIARGEDKWGDWNWEARRLIFRVPENVQFVEVVIRRNRTDALDKRIKGALWLDEFSIVPMAPVGYER